MRTGGVLNIFGKFLILLSLFVLTPIPFSIYYGDGMTGYFVLCGLIGGALGSGLVTAFRPEQELGHRDGFAIVVFSWLGSALLGALPYYLSGAIGSFADAFFESMSGFTTTGSTILSVVEQLPASLLFWRALTHWLGGMGIIVLSLAILPFLGIGGMQLFQAEVTGPTKDRLTPRIQDTARVLWSVYFLFTLVATFLLMLGGMNFFDALCHSFSAASTGGFANYTASIGYYDSVYLETILIVFMFLGSINFSLHYQGLHGKLGAYWRNEEFRFYLALSGLAIMLITLVNLYRGVYGHFGDSLRASAFQVVSILTTTGFGTADFDQWPAVAKAMLVALMFVGGCAGSTSGGIKVVRILLFFKYARLQLRNLVHPRAVGTIKLGKLKVPQEIMVAILGYFALYVAFFITATILVTALGVELGTGAMAVLATLNNIGPGLEQVGPAQNFGGLPTMAKWILSICMLAGRLELYTLAVLLTPDYWAMARRPRWRWRPITNGEGRASKENVLAS
jgi:trk system potassium uptake protein